MEGDRSKLGGACTGGAGQELGYNDQRPHPPPRNETKIFVFVLDGCVGSGKSTILKELSRAAPDIAVFPEPLEEWLDYRGVNLFQGFSNAARRGEPGLALQMLVFSTLVKRYLSAMTSGKQIAVLERGFSSACNVFLPCMTGLLPIIDLGLLLDMNRLAFHQWERQAYSLLLVCDRLENHKRFSRRGRPEEVHINPARFQEIWDAYDYVRRAGGCRAELLPVWTDTALGDAGRTGRGGENHVTGQRSQLLGEEHVRGEKMGGAEGRWVGGGREKGEAGQVQDKSEGRSRLPGPTPPPNQTLRPPPPNMTPGNVGEGPPHVFDSTRQTPRECAERIENYIRKVVASESSSSTRPSDFGSKIPGLLRETSPKGEGRRECRVCGRSTPPLPPSPPHQPTMTSSPNPQEGPGGADSGLVVDSTPRSPQADLGQGDRGVKKDEQPPARGKEGGSEPGGEGVEGTGGGTEEESVEVDGEEELPATQVMEESPEEGEEGVEGVEEEEEEEGEEGEKASDAKGPPPGFEEAARTAVEAAAVLAAASEGTGTVVSLTVAEPRPRKE